MNKEIIIGMPPGIGDLHWIMTKMESFKKKNGIEKIKIVMNLLWMTQNNRHTYSLDYLKLIPFIDSGESKDEIMPFEYALAGGSGKPFFKNVGGCDYLIEFNSSLEAGIPLKEILPEYDTNFDYPISRPPYADEYAQKIKRLAGGKLFLIFTASTLGNDIWANKLWGPWDWMKLVDEIYKTTKCKPVVIGGSWDKDYVQRLNQLNRNNSFIDIVGHTNIIQLFALLRAADLLVAFQCGVMMMAVQFRTPTVGFWPIKSKTNPTAKLKRPFMRSWLPPWAEEVGYMPFGWGDEDATPEGILTAIRRYL